MQVFTLYRVQSLHLSHSIISNHLRKIIQTTESTRLSMEKSSYVPIPIQYLAEGIEGATSKDLLVTRKVYTGYQWSLFKNLDRHEDEWTFEDKMCWNDEYIIEDTSSGISIIISGNDRVGVLHYIESYGFYEGGILNEYRIDPYVALFIIAGIPTQGAYDYLVQKADMNIQQCIDEYHLNIKSIDDQVDDIEQNIELKKIAESSMQNQREVFEIYKNKIRDHISKS